MTNNDDTKPRWRLRRLFQFRLRTVIFLMFVACFGMGIWYQIREHVEPFRQQQAALAELEGKYDFVATENACPWWLKPFFDESEFKDVVQLSFLNRYAFKDDDAKYLKEFPRLKKLSLQNTGLTNKGLAEIAGLVHLEKLSLKRMRISDKDIAHLRRLRNLRVLHLSYTNTTGDALQQLSHLPIEDLELFEVEIDDDHLAELKKFRRLKKLAIGPHQMTDEGLGRLAQLTQLRELRISEEENTSIQLADFPNLESIEIHSLMMRQVRLSHMPKLRHIAIRKWHENMQFHVSLVDLPEVDQLELYVRAISGLEIDGLPKLELLDLSNSNLKRLSFANMPNLQGINLNDSVVSEPMLRSISRLPALESLLMANCFCCEANSPVRSISRRQRSPVSAHELSALVQSRSIRTLDLRETGLDDRAVQWLGAMVQLEFLVLTKNPIFDEGIRTLSGLENLKTLHLSRTFASDRCLLDLSDMNLEILDLKRTNVTDRGMTHLSKMSSLRRLDLLMTDVSYQGLTKLNPLPNLERVHINQPPVELEEARAPELYEYADAKRILPFTDIVPVPLSIDMD